jgi:hypothetical protein
MAFPLRGRAVALRVEPVFASLATFVHPSLTHAPLALQPPSQITALLGLQIGARRAAFCVGSQPCRPYHRLSLVNSSYPANIAHLFSLCNGRPVGAETLTRSAQPMAASACGFLFLHCTGKTGGYFYSQDERLRKNGGMADQYILIPQQKN